MVVRRLSKLQRHILHLMWTQYERTQGGISTGHLDLVHRRRIFILCDPLVERKQPLPGRPRG